MNDVDFPVARVLEGIDAAAAAGLAPIKINMVVKRGVNEHDILPMARYFRGSGHILRFIEYMDVGAHQRLAHGRRRDRARDRRHDRRGDAARAGGPQLSRRSRRALALPGRRRRDRRASLRSRRRSAAIARARGCPPTASSTPASSRPPGTTCARCCAAARRTTRSQRAIACDLVAAQPTAIRRSARRTRRS